MSTHHHCLSFKHIKVFKLQRISTLLVNIWCKELTVYVAPITNETLSTKLGEMQSMHRLNVILATWWNSWVVRGNALKAFALPHQRPLQDDTALLVALTFLCSKFVHPAQLAIAVLAADISHHVIPCQHLSVLHITMLQIYNLESRG